MNDPGRMHVQSGSRCEPGYVKSGNRRQVSVPIKFSRCKKGIRQLNNDDYICEQMLTRQARSATTTKVGSIPRQGLFSGDNQKGKANYKRGNGRFDNSAGDYINRDRKGTSSKSADPETAKEHECRSNISVASAPSTPPPSSTVYNMGQYDRCDCPCRKFDITRKSWAVMRALQELYDELCSIQGTPHSCMDWQPSSTTYILREKFVADAATLTSAMNFQ